MQFAVFCINPHLSRSALRKQFKSFLQNQPQGCRPVDVRIDEQRGEGADTRVADKELRALGAYRLLKIHKLHWTEAFALSAAVSKTGKEGLYGGKYPRPWRDAVRLAQAMIEKKATAMLYHTGVSCSQAACE